MGWQQQIPGCFGAQDAIWGSHPLDQQRARNMLKAAIDAGATMDEIVAEAVQYLQGRGAQAQHIQDQEKLIRNLSF